MAFRIKVKQMASGAEVSGKHIITDGAGGFKLDYPNPQQGTEFPANPTSGNTYYRTDINELFCYDSSRNKWLSVNKVMLNCGRISAESGTTSYMYVGSAVQSSASGFRMPYNGTIVSVSIQNSVS